MLWYIGLLIVLKWAFYLFRFTYKELTASERERAGYSGRFQEPKE